MKKAFYLLPKPLKQLIVQLIEFTGFTYSKYKNPSQVMSSSVSDKKKHILIYHKSALSFGGTEKNLQMIAKYLDKVKYKVFLMDAISSKTNRLEYLQDSDVTVIPFSYTSVMKRWPYVIEGMNPSFEDVLRTHNIDCIITATPGQTIDPIIRIRNIPIILLNIFGSFSVQRNIRKHICISHEVKKLASRVVDEVKLEVQYIPSERPLRHPLKSKQLRNSFQIADNDLVFGRIGRADDSIFDPIGILAFEIAVKTNPHIYYLIMSPPEAAKKLVRDHSIPNIHWVDPSYKEEDIWAFHGAIDVLAHFRVDGESCGLNIIESMLIGNPILTHKSHIWNAHLEYLDNRFSLVAEKDDYVQYAAHMATFIDMHKNGTLIPMGQIAQEKAEKTFLIENVIRQYESWIDESIHAL